MKCFVSQGSFLLRIELLKLGKQVLFALPFLLKTAKPGLYCLAPVAELSGGDPAVDRPKQLFIH